MSGGAERQSAAPLEGLRCLIVEDEYLLALLLQDELCSAGCTIADSVGDLERAREAASRADFDIAVLDVNLSGEMVYPFADELAERGVPFVFLSGYGLANFPERFRGRPRVAKPYEIGELIREISRSLRKS